MNVLVATLGSYGDVYPKVGLALALKQRGHRVTFYTNPFFEKLAGKYDLDFVPIGTMEQYLKFANHPALFDPRKSVSVFFDNLILPNINVAYERLLERCKGDDTVIVSSITVFSARMIQEKHHIPNVTVHLAPMAFKSAYEMPQNAFFPFPDWLPLALKRFYWWVADKFVVDRMIGPALNAFRKEIGFTPVERIMTRWGHSPQMVIGMFPEWYAAPKPDWPPITHLTGFPLFDEGEENTLAPEVESFLDQGEPPIIFMPGSLMQHADSIFEMAVRSCQQLGIRAILLSRYSHQIPRLLPEGVRHFEYVPLEQILKRASALVHHGGIGTCAQALKAGVPQLIHPMAYDQFDNAWRLQQLGVGDSLVPSCMQVENLVDKLGMLTQSSDVRTRCQDVAARFEGKNALVETCALIETFA
jgi:UDP:flavonoid glycosyltransferase YjiC (YdhE family)